MAKNSLRTKSHWGKSAKTTATFPAPRGDRRVVQRRMLAAPVKNDQRKGDRRRAEASRPETSPFEAGRQFRDAFSEPDALGLVVGVAHDLRSPLTSILFLADALQRGLSGEVNDVQRRQLRLIYSAALGLSGMASDVIELARGSNRLADDTVAPLWVTDILESVRDVVRPMAEEKGLTIRLLPPPRDHREGQAFALSRVLLNLTTNALKFTDMGFVEIVAREAGPTRVEFSVRDTGPGIAPTALDTLYEPFPRSVRDNGQVFSGTGLGLSLCQRLVELMGSELRFETRPEWGTRFFFELEMRSVEKRDA